MVVDVFSDGHKVAEQVPEILSSLVTSVPEHEHNESIPEDGADILVWIWDIVTTNTILILNQYQTKTKPLLGECVRQWRQTQDFGYHRPMQKNAFICHIDDIKIFLILFFAWY